MIRIRFVARHQIAKADDRVAERVVDKLLLEQPFRQLRQLRLLRRTFLAFFACVARVALDGNPA